MSTCNSKKFFRGLYPRTPANREGEGQEGREKARRRGREGGREEKGKARRREGKEEGKKRERQGEGMKGRKKGRKGKGKEKGKGCKGDTLHALLVWYHHNLAGFSNSNNDFCCFLSVITRYYDSPYTLLETD
jgi:hypothetical protein